MISDAVEDVRARLLGPAADLALRCGVSVPGADPIRGILRAFASATSDRRVTFVQIGSNDGATNDPLRAFAQRYAWSGVLVEPVPYVFARLRERRGADTNVALENAAVADGDDDVLFYHPKQRRPGEELPTSYDRPGSFSPETILTREGDVPGLRDGPDTAVVPTVTFEALCAWHCLRTVDLIHVDAAVDNWQILRQIDLDRFRPGVVLYEHVHLTAEEQRDATELLTARGYLWHETADDTIGIRHEALLGEPSVARVWRQSTRAVGARLRRMQRSRRRMGPVTS